MLILHLGRFCGHGLVSNGSKLGSGELQWQSKLKTKLAWVKGVNWVKRSLTVLCRRPRKTTSNQEFETKTKTRALTVSQWHRPSETLAKSENSDRTVVSFLLHRKLQLEKAGGKYWKVNQNKSDGGAIRGTPALFRSRQVCRLSLSFFSFRFKLGSTDGAFTGHNHNHACDSYRKFGFRILLLTFWSYSDLFSKTLEKKEIDDSHLNICDPSQSFHFWQKFFLCQVKVTSPMHKLHLKVWDSLQF